MEATLINTETASTGIYFTTTPDLSETLASTISARPNDTDVKPRDFSGERPESKGDQCSSRVKPAIGLTWRWNMP